MKPIIEGSKRGQKIIGYIDAAGNKYDVDKKPVKLVTETPKKPTGKEDK